MAQHEIVRKLNQQLAEPIRSERQVVYILAELRKLLEITGNERNYPALKFCCDWALHPRMDRRAAQEIVEVFNRREELRYQVEHGDEQPRYGADAAQKFMETVQLERFRQQFRKFCAQQEIAGRLLDDDEEWGYFLRHYVHVIEDCPLISEAPGLKFVKKVEVRAQRLAQDEYVLNMVWEWESEMDKPNTRTCMAAFALPYSRREAETSAGRDREAALARLREGIASMQFFSNGRLPTREELHDRS